MDLLKILKQGDARRATLDHRRDAGQRRQELPAVVNDAGVLAADDAGQSKRLLASDRNARSPFLGGVVDDRGEQRSDGGEDKRKELAIEGAKHREPSAIWMTILPSYEARALGRKFLGDEWCRGFAHWLGARGGGDPPGRRWDLVGVNRVPRHIAPLSGSREPLIIPPAVRCLLARSASRLRRRDFATEFGLHRVVGEGGHEATVPLLNVARTGFATGRRACARSPVLGTPR